jgi:hypothetical protein
MPHQSGFEERRLCAPATVFCSGLRRGQTLCRFGECKGGFSPHPRLRKAAVISTALTDYWRVVQSKHNSCSAFVPLFCQLAAAASVCRGVRLSGIEHAAE